MDILIFLTFLVVAFLYSSAGHGGASGYLAIMALFNFPHEHMKATALILNVFVSLLAFWSFYRGGHFRLRILLPFVITSIPMSFIGAKVSINPRMFNISLGILLIFATARILYKVSESGNTKPVPFIPALLTGALLGFFSGAIGIGGGIILSPLLLLFGWANLKQTAAASAMFIFLNSLSGLSGLWSQGIALPPGISLWIIAGITGGLLGSYAGSFRYSVKLLKFTLSAILIIASIKLFMI
jgi:uncharacterized membrane protein YfcA